MAPLLRIPRQKRFKSVLNSVDDCKGLQEVYKRRVIMAKINLWRVNFTDRRARFVNSWTNVRRDLPPEIYVTLEFFPYISRKPLDLPGTSHTRRESWSFPFYTNNAWNAFSTISWKFQDFPETSHKREIWSFLFKDSRRLECCLLSSLYRLTIRVFVA